MFHVICCLLCSHKYNMFGLMTSECIHTKDKQDFRVSFHLHKHTHTARSVLYLFKNINLGK